MSFIKETTKKELTSHLPHSMFFVLLAMVVLGIMSNYGMIGLQNHSHDHKYDHFKEEGYLFSDMHYLFHAMHIILSAAATTALFYKYERRVVKAFIIGILGAVLWCSLSDVVLPYLAGVMMGIDMEIHACIIEHPALILPFIGSGIILGVMINNRKAYLAHGGHVFASSLASVLYLYGYGLDILPWMYPILFVIMILAVVIPCCLSDILFPILFVRDKQIRQEMRKDHCDSHNCCE
jgi:hypothetical protein